MKVNMNMNMNTNVGMNMNMSIDFKNNINTDISRISIFNLIHSALISASLVLIFNTAFQLGKYPVLTFIYVAVFMLIIFLYFSGSNTMRYIFIISAVFVILFMLLIFTRGSIKGMFYSIYNFFKWTIDYLSGYQNSHIIYSPCLTIFVSFLTTLFVYIFIVQRNTFLPVLAAGGVILYIQHIYELPSSLPGFYMLLFLMLIQYMKTANHTIVSINPGNYAALSRLMLWIVPVCIISLSLAIRIPESSRPIQWNWLDEKINKLLGVHGYTYLPDYSFSEVVFQTDSATLGGDISLDDNIVLKVDSPRFLYLKGASRDMYTGNSWVSTDKTITPANSKNNNMNIDTLEMKKSFELLTNQPGFISRNFYLDTITISFVNLQTKSLFAPSKINYMSFSKDSRDNIYNNADGVLISKKMNKKGFTYSLEVYSPKYENEDFINALRNSRHGLYYSISGKNPSTSVEEDMQQIYSNYLKIKEKYCQLPPSLPPRVKELAINIASSAQNNYDKVKALEDFLSTSYTYTLTPGEPPKNTDFVDYFLFTSRKGYCTYYASAMTVLVRCLGIPARYVEGYMLPPSPESEKTYIVTNKLAHAWVEVYFEGYGWLPFEPTSQYNGLFYAAPAAKSRAEQQASVAYSGVYEEYIEELIDETYDEFLPEESQSTWIFIVIPILFTLTAVLIAILVNKRKIHVMLWKFKKMPAQEGIISIYECIIKKLAVLGMPIKPHETPGEYATRLAESPETSIPDFFGATDIFQKARYGLYGDISIRDRDDILRFLLNLSDFEVQKLGKLKYFIFHNLLGFL